MLEFLNGGIIKGRLVKYDQDARLKHNRKVDTLRKQSLTDVAIAKRLGVEYFTVAKRSITEPRY